MLKIGIVGFGFMGRMHYANWKNQKDATVVALCDADPNLIENTKKTVGNIEGNKADIDFSNLTVYSDLDKMLASEKLDALSITLPTHLHATFSRKALAAGLHVLCEKPMAFNQSQCQEMISAAQDSGKLLQIGHCVRFWPEYAHAKEIVARKTYGDVIAASFRRLASPPDWSQDNWLQDEKRSGGLALDLHIHDTDFIHYLFGLPQSVLCLASKNNNVTQHLMSHYDYEDKKLVTAEAGWAMTPSFGFEMSFNLVLEQATIVYDCTRDPVYKICPHQGDSFSPEVVCGDGYELEITHFTNAVLGTKQPEVITLQQSMDSVRIVEAEIQSICTNKIVQVGVF